MSDDARRGRAIPRTCEMHAECHREPVGVVEWSEDHTAETGEWLTFKKWACKPCGKALVRGHGAGNCPIFQTLNEVAD
jgi:hypothetical protein